MSLFYSKYLQLTSYIWNQARKIFTQKKPDPENKQFAD